jgi:stearoyl-CoA desaturase (delta-9 desaturase)
LNAAVNAIGHTSGKRPFEKTYATNGALLALLTAGEGLHSNHHAAPTSARLSWRWHEPDPGWLMIRGLLWTGLITLRHAGGMVPATR